MPAAPLLRSSSLAACTSSLGLQLLGEAELRKALEATSSGVVTAYDLRCVDGCFARCCVRAPAK